MLSFWNQLPALIGVIVGSAGTMLATTLTDRARWRRDQSTRWDQRRLDAYVEYAATIKEIHAFAFRLAAATRPEIPAQPIERATGLEMLAQANMRRTQVLEKVRLLGDQATVIAAREWDSAVWKWARLASEPVIDTAAWTSAVQAVDNARDHFYAAARANLKVGGGLVAQSSQGMLTNT